MIKGNNRRLVVTVALGMVLMVVACVLIWKIGATSRQTSESIVSESQKKTGADVQNASQGGQFREKDTKPIIDMHQEMDIDFRMRLLDDVTDTFLEEAMRQPKSLVKLRFHGSAPYYSLAKAFTEESLPQFYEVLKDAEASGHEKDHAVLFIGQIAARGDRKAQEALSEFIAEKVNWEKWKPGSREVDLLVTSKYHALEMLGYLGNKETHRLLRNLMSAEGATYMAKQWIEGVPSAGLSRGAVLANLRGFAAKGLAFSDERAELEAVEKEYTQERNACVESGVLESHYFYQLCDAMARRDIIAEIGLDAHRGLYDGSMAYSNIYVKHVRKYMLRQTDPD